jgi:hypothetical protein
MCLAEELENSAQLSIIMSKIILTVVLSMLLLFVVTSPYKTMAQFPKVTLDLTEITKKNEEAKRRMEAQMEELRRKNEEKARYEQMKNYAFILFTVLATGFGLLKLNNQSKGNNVNLVGTAKKVSVPTSNSNDIYAELENLAKLKEKGIINEDEFLKMKASILSKT